MNKDPQELDFEQLDFFDNDWYFFYEEGVDLGMHPDEAEAYADRMMYEQDEDDG